ncbi:MAG TPA: DUF3592 domain-containing protein [Vicinamibacteria bacterium]|nr:DUF3592 domain-containing protein [Vicinamibacteria bacterium]
MNAPSSSFDDRERRLRAAAKFKGPPLPTLIVMAVVLLLGLVPILLAVHTAWSARRWVETPVELLDVNLQTLNPGEFPPATDVRATYRYRMGDAFYVGRRIGVHLPITDNSGEWQREWVERLRHRGSETPPLTAWVNPEHPDEAVLDRSLRWDVLLVHAFLVVVPLWPLWLAARALVARRRLRSYIK